MISCANSSIERLPLAGSTPGTCIAMTKWVQDEVFDKRLDFARYLVLDCLPSTPAHRTSGECRVLL